MGVTNFPDGIATGSGTVPTYAGGSVAIAAGTFTLGTAVMAAGTVATGLTTVSFGQASLATLGTGSFAVAAVPSSGNLIFAVNNSSGAAATVGGTIHWVAFGA